MESPSCLKSEVGNGVAVHRKGVLKEVVLVVHRAEVVLQLAFEQQVLLVLPALPKEVEGLKETRSGFLRETLRPQFHTFFI